MTLPGAVLEKLAVFMPSASANNNFPYLHFRLQVQIKQLLIFTSNNWFGSLNDKRQVRGAPDACRAGFYLLFPRGLAMLLHQVFERGWLKVQVALDC